MLKHVYLILVTTFLFGSVSGVILYLANNTGVEGAGNLEDVSSEVLVTARMYGECEQAGQCAAYRIEGGGAYTYIVQTQDGSKRFEGELSRSERRELNTLLSGTDLIHLSGRVTGECLSGSRELGFRYTITRREEELSFDSCEVLLAGTPLFDTLEGFFETFSTQHNVDTI